MADFNSALNGQQMDAALMDVALHNSEAYAVGTRNGVPVTSADETYHNNAKYYAAVAKSAIPGTYTAAVRWDIDQGLPEAGKDQARANIRAGASNRNLLDNPWFTVSQRSTSGTITSGYIADRWYISYGSGGVTASRTEDTITIKSTSGSSHGDIVQRMEKGLFNSLLGKTVTASIMRADGSIVWKSFTFTSSANSISIGNDLDGNSIVFRAYQTSTYQDVQFWKWYTNGTFRAVKLELGAYSTLANDLPPDYAEELQKCQYRAVVYDLSGNFLIGRGIATSSTNIRMVIDLPTTMANDKTPTVTLTGSLTTPQGNTITAISAAGTARNNKLPINCTVSGVTGGNAYDIHTGSATPKIVISADL